MIKGTRMAVLWFAKIKSGLKSLDFVMSLALAITKFYLGISGKGMTISRLRYWTYRFKGETFSGSMNACDSQKLDPC